MSLLLVSSPNNSFYVAPQLGPYRIQHYLQQRGIHCDMLDIQIDDLEEFIASHAASYTIVGLSGSHSSMADCLDLAARLKQAYPTARYIVGGVSPTHNPETWLEAGFDAVILGYGEEVLHQYYRYISGVDTDLHAIQGIAFLHEGHCVIQPATLLSPELFYELTYHNALSLRIPYERYWEANKALHIVDSNDFIIKTVRLFTSSQCPNHCGYCSSKFIAHAQDAPTRIYALTAEEMTTLITEEYHKYQPDSVFFNDDEFLFDKKRARSFCDCVIRAKQTGELPEHLYFECQSRSIDFFQHRRPDKDFIRLLKQAGFRRISIGTENFSERLLARPIMNKILQPIEDVLALFDIFQIEQVLLQVNMMLFIPETTREELINNIICIYNFAQRNTPVNLNTYVLANPGAPALSHGNYSLHYTDLISPINGKSLRLPAHYRLHDATLEQLLLPVKDVIQAEKTAFVAQVGWTEHSLAKAYTSPLVCMGILRAIGESTLYKQFEKLLLAAARNTPPCPQP